MGETAFNYLKAYTYEQESDPLSGVQGLHVLNFEFESNLNEFDEKDFLKWIEYYKTSILSKLDFEVKINNRIIILEVIMSDEDISYFEVNLLEALK
jgi:hypothetical protein